MVTDAILSALGTVLTFQHIQYLMIGVLTGLVVGVLPGLGGIVGMSLLLPFVYGMEPTLALAMLIGILPVLSTSDTFASILMGSRGRRPRRRRSWTAFRWPRRARRPARSARHSRPRSSAVCSGRWS